MQKGRNFRGEGLCTSQSSHQNGTGRKRSRTPLQPGGASRSAGCALCSRLVLVRFRAKLKLMVVGENGAGSVGCELKMLWDLIEPSLLPEEMGSCPVGQ